MSKKNDYNFCRNGVAPALKSLVTIEDALTIITWIDQIENEYKTETTKTDDAFIGFICGASEILSYFNLADIKSFFPRSKLNSFEYNLKTKIFCELLTNYHTDEALNIAADLLLLYPAEVSVTICFIANIGFEANQFSWESFEINHVKALMEYIEDDRNDEKRWGLDTLSCILQQRPDLAEQVEKIIPFKEKVVGAIYAHCINKDNSHVFFDIYKQLIKLQPWERNNQKVSLLKGYNLDWSEREELFLEILETFDINIVKTLFSPGVPTDVNNLALLNIKNVIPFLEWFQHLLQTNDDDYFLQQVGSCLGKHSDNMTQQLFINEFNKTNSQYRKIIQHYLFEYIDNVSLEAFSYDAITFLLDDLSRENAVSKFHGHLIGRIATEKFIDNTLLPLFNKSSSTIKDNLSEVLNQAGSRLGRRYLN